MIENMLDEVLLQTLDRLTAGEQKTILAVAEFLKSQREATVDSQELSEALLGEMQSKEPAFRSSDEGLSPARLAARNFMREHPDLMRLLAR